MPKTLFDCDECGDSVQSNEKYIEIDFKKICLKCANAHRSLLSYPLSDPEKPVTHCFCCDIDLYDNDPAFEYDGHTFCDNCFHDFIQTAEPESNEDLEYESWRDDNI